MKTSTFLIWIAVIIAFAASQSPRQPVEDITPREVRIWRGELSWHQGDAIILTNDLEDLRLANEYGVHEVVSQDQLKLTNGEIVSSAYPEGYFDNGLTPPSYDSSIYYIDRNGDLIGKYQVKDPANAPDFVLVYLKPVTLPSCKYPDGITAKLTDTGRLYFIEIFDENGVWDGSCDL